jgi:transcriptional regulator with XRE-family HTH domain
MQTGRKILNLRCDRKISQQDLARACDITPSALSKIEAGINSPRASVIWRIARNLGVTVEYLLDESIPYPYAGYSYRQECLTNDVDPNATVRMDVSREEKGFLDALRKTSSVSRDVAFSIPEITMENLRLVHFLLHHSKIQNPSQTFIKSFESLITTGNVGAEETEKKVDAAQDGARRRKRGRPPKNAAAGRSPVERAKPGKPRRSVATR